MGLLEVATADFSGRNVGGDRQNRNTAAVCIEQTVDEMQIAWAARSGTDRETAGNLRLTAGGEGGDLFVSNVNPADLLPAAQRLGQAVQAITDHAEYALYVRLYECFCDEVCNIVDAHGR
jgi:hypothetical protein